MERERQRNRGHPGVRQLLVGAGLILQRNVVLRRLHRTRKRRWSDDRRLRWNQNLTSGAVPMIMSNKKSQRGNAILEFAVGWSLLCGLFAGIYQFGYAFYAYNVLITAVSNAAQLGSRLSYDKGDPSSYKSQLQNMVVYGDTTAGTKSILPGLDTGKVDVSVT